MIFTFFKSMRSLSIEIIHSPTYLTLTHRWGAHTDFFDNISFKISINKKHCDKKVIEV